MSEIFNIIGNLAFTKKKPFLLTCEEIKEFSPYMINRWLSMIDENYAPLINEYQKYINCMDVETYNTFLFLVLPKIKRKHFTYIKNGKVTKVENGEIREKICENLEISRKELDILDEDGKLSEMIKSKGFTQ